MQNINRLVILTAIVAFFGFVAGATPASAQTKEARGTVTAVTTTTMTVKVGAQDTTFYIDGDTHLEVRRAAKQIQAAQPDGRSRGSTISSRPAIPSWSGIEKRTDGIMPSMSSASAALVPRTHRSSPRERSRRSPASHVTVAADGHDMTFAITGDTDVLVKGASKATKAAGGGTPLTTFVHSGDTVSVSYKDAAGAHDRIRDSRASR